MSVVRPLFIFNVKSLKHEALISRKKHLICDNQTTIQIFLQNNLNMEYFYRR